MLVKIAVFCMAVSAIVMDWKAHNGGWVVADIIGGIFTGGLLPLVRFIYLITTGA